MSASVYSTRFLAGTPSGSLTEYTVPSGYVAVVRDISGSQPIKSLTDFVAVGSLVIGTFFIVYASATQATTVHWEGRVVAPAGEKLYMVSTYNTGSLSVSGYLLTLP